MNETMRVEERKKRRARKKRQKAAKRILLAFAFLVLALAAFLVTIKICKPDFDFKVLIPQAAVTFVKEDLLKQTTTTAGSVTKPKTTKPAYLDYLDASDFAFDTSAQGNQIGNILNKSGGAVTYNASYIYFAKKGSGIYRFTPSEEDTIKLAIDVKNAASLNIVGSDLYFVDTKSHKLLRCSASGGKTTVLAENVRQCYAYQDKVFYIGTDETCGLLNTQGGSKTQLFAAASGNQLAFVGISLSRAFLTEYAPDKNTVQYISVSLTDQTDLGYFRPPSAKGDLVSMQLENGFFYYYKKQADATYDLCRQKFGSSRETVLLENTGSTDYPVVYANRLYYAQVSGGQFKARELNMNTKKKKTVLQVPGANNSGSLAVACGYQYIFLLGTKKDGGSPVYKGTCIYTSASADNTMDFRDGKWRY